MGSVQQGIERLKLRPQECDQLLLGRGRESWAPRQPAEAVPADRRQSAPRRVPSPANTMSPFVRRTVVTLRPLTRVPLLLPGSRNRYPCSSHSSTKCMPDMCRSSATTKSASDVRPTRTDWPASSGWCVLPAIPTVFEERLA